MSTLQTYRQQTARGLGGYEDRGVRSVGGGRLTTAAGTQASLIEARWPIQRARIMSDFYVGALLYRTGVGAHETFQDFDRVRQVGAEGYDGENGKFIPDTDWMTAPLAGEEFELHTHGFDPQQQLTGLINDALRAITLVVDVEMTLATDARGSYVPALDADGNDLAGWLTAPEQILSVRPTATPGPASAINGPAFWPASLRGKAWIGGGRLYLSGAYWPANHVWAQCYKPAFYHCRAGGATVFGSQAGLTPGGDAGEAVPEPDWVAAGAVALAWESFDDMESAAQRIKGQRYQAAKAAFYQRQSRYYEQHPVDKSFVPYGVQV